MITNAIKITDINMTYELPETVYLNTSNSGSYLNEIKKINKLPFIDGEYYFSDDIWDFSQLIKVNITRSKLKFRFDDISIHFKDICKSYVLIRIIENKAKTQTIYQWLRETKRFIKFLNSINLFDVMDITEMQIESYLNMHKHKQVPTKRSIKFSIKDFLMFYQMNIDNTFPTSVIKCLNQDDYREFKAHLEENKTPPIPSDYFDDLIKYSLIIMDDETVRLDIRAVACITVLLSQTGLRIGEILGLKVDAIRPHKMINGEVIYYLNYLTWKRESGNNVTAPAFTYVNELTIKAFNKLKVLHQFKRDKLKLEYLFMGGPQMNQKKFFPIDSNSYSRIQKRFYLYMNQFIPTINLDEEMYPTLTRCSLEHVAYIIKDYPHAKHLTYPGNHQFRVNVCTNLYNAGVPLKYISKFMAHLSSEMEGYYVRPKSSNTQENADFALETLQNVVSGELNLLGASSGLMTKINDFIKENNYNVKKDLNVICDELSERIPIRQKTGGLCIKSSMFRECSNDAMTNEFYCAYGVCPNIFHFYYMSDLSYRQAKELLETIEINQIRGHLRQAQKELNMLKYILKNKLKPEIDELLKVLKQQGIHSILRKYPDLIEIIENLDTILKEMEEWRTMKIS